MPFQKGQPRPPGAGRKKGSVNRATVAAILDKFRCDPIEGMIRLAQDKHQAAALRARMYAELAKYRWPTLRAIEVSGPAGAAEAAGGALTVRVVYVDKPPKA